MLSTAEKITKYSKKPPLGHFFIWEAFRCTQSISRIKIPLMSPFVENFFNFRQKNDQVFFKHPVPLFFKLTVASFTSNFVISNTRTVPRHNCKRLCDKVSVS